MVTALAATFLMSVPAGLAAAPVQGPDLQVRGSFTPAQITRGKTVRATVVLTIPGGYHANANKVLESYLIPTSLKLTTSGGATVGAVSYPRGVLKKFGFSGDKSLSVYEGRVTMTFNVTVPASFSGNELLVSGELRVQACDDKTCFAPKTLKLGIRGQVK
ncbi:MAG: protein-disulfide reductase DsbD domain-containing protein [Pyrinomonadaceae bacterium]